MTTLAAIQGDGWCAIGADNRASDESGFTMQIVTGKIFRNGPALIAGAGSVRGINLLQFGWKSPTCRDTSTDKYMTRAFIPSMRKKFIESGYDMKGEGDVATNDNDFLVAVKGTLYSVADDYSWERCRMGIYIAGSGGKYALGALAALGASEVKSADEAAEMLRKAIAVSIRYDVFSGGDIDVEIQRA